MSAAQREADASDRWKALCELIWPHDVGGQSPIPVKYVMQGASNYTFACAHWSQKQQDWLDAHVQAFTFFGVFRR